MPSEPLEAAARALYPGIWESATADEKEYCYRDATLVIEAAVDAMDDNQGAVVGNYATIDRNEYAPWYNRRSMAIEVRAAIKRALLGEKPE